MTGRWSRRSLLAALGTAAVAGCLSDGDPGGSTGGPGDGTTTASPSPDGTPTTSPTDVHTVSGTEPGPGTPSRTDTPGTDAEPPEETATAPSSVESDWPVPGADTGRSNAVDEATGPTADVAELWYFSAGTELSAPVLADGTLYVGGDDGTVRALDARSGGTRWSASAGTSAGTPRVVDDRLFVPVDGGLVALSLADGNETWRVETSGRRGLVVADHGIYWVDERGPTVVALSLADGSEQWRTDIADPWEPRVFASEDRVFVSCGPYDNRFWRLDAGTGEQYNEPPRSGADFPAEQCYRAGTVYGVDAFFGNVDATAVSGAGASWSQGVPPGGEAGGGLVAVGDERVYYTANIDDEPGLTALSTADGTVEWTADVPSAVTGRPAVASEAVVVPTAEGLRSFDPADGSEQWATDARAGSELLVVDDIVYTTTDTAAVAYRPP